MKRVYIGLLSITVLFGCTRNKAMNSFRDEFPDYREELEMLDMEIIKGKWINDYVFLNNDTSKYLFLSYFVSKTDNHKKGDVGFGKFITRQVRDSVIEVKAFDRSRKLIYSYNRVGDYYYNISGKYTFYFRHKRNLLTRCQRLYFLENEDSIMNNLVDEIPVFDSECNIIE